MPANISANISAYISAAEPAEPPAPTTGGMDSKKWASAGEWDTDELEDEEDIEDWTKPCEEEMEELEKTKAKLKSKMVNLSLGGAMWLKGVLRQQLKTPMDKFRKEKAKEMVEHVTRCHRDTIMMPQGIKIQRHHHDPGSEDKGVMPDTQAGAAAEANYPQAQRLTAHPTTHPHSKKLIVAALSKLDRYRIYCLQLTEEYHTHQKEIVHSDSKLAKIVFVIGPIASGKTTLANQLASASNCTHVDCDAVCPCSDQNGIHTLQLSAERNPATAFAIARALVEDGIVIVSNGGGIYNQRLLASIRTLLGTGYRITTSVCAPSQHDDDNRDTLLPVETFPDDTLRLYHNTAATADRITTRVAEADNDPNSPWHRMDKQTQKMLVNKSFKNGEVVKSDSMFSHSTVTRYTWHHDSTLSIKMSNPRLPDCDACTYNGGDKAIQCKQERDLVIVQPSNDPTTLEGWCKHNKMKMSRITGGRHVTAAFHDTIVSIQTSQYSDLQQAESIGQLAKDFADPIFVACGTKGKEFAVLCSTTTDKHITLFTCASISPRTMRVVAKAVTDGQRTGEIQLVGDRFNTTVHLTEMSILNKVVKLCFVGQIAI